MSCVHSAMLQWYFQPSFVTVHCNKTDREIPVHTHDDAGRQRFCTGKYFPYESGINTCLAPEVFHTSGIFQRYTA
jgi:hypothetical protein